MNRYSTINVEIEADFGWDNMADIWVTFEQGKNKVTKKKSEGQISTEDYLCKTVLAQQDTALFMANTPIFVQCRWVDSKGVSDSASVDYFTLGDVLEEGVMGV